MTGTRPADDCVFCAIVVVEKPARVLVDVDRGSAFLDANRLAPGHTLVVLKGHFETFTDTPPPTLAGMFELLGELTPAIQAAVEADASNVGFNNGRVAGQAIPHLHGHIIPRFAGHGGRSMHAVAGSAPTLSDDDLDAIAERIRQALAAR